MNRTAGMLLALLVVGTTAALRADRSPSDLPSDLRSAERVVVGQVVRTDAFRQRNAWGDDLIVTRATVRADETLKGPVEGLVAVDVEGGTLNGLTLRVSDLPTMKPGDRAVFLLKRNAAGAQSPYHRGAGILKLSPNDTVTGTTMTLGDIRRLAAAAR